METAAVILAAGLGKRMKSRRPKVLHRVAGRSLVEHVLAAVEEAGIEKRIVVIGHRGEEVKAQLGSRCTYVLQEKQLGTGHAVMQAREAVGQAGTVLVLCGDTPLIRGDTLKELLECHLREGAAVTLLTALLEDPGGYGRIIRDTRGRIVAIAEEADASPEQRAIKEVNGGFYCFSAPFLWAALGSLTPDNRQGEFYLTDVVNLAVKQGLKVASVQPQEAEEILGVNDRIQLAKVAALWRKRINRAFMEGGVTFIDPEATYVDVTVEIGPDTIVYPGTFLEGATVIGSGCTVGPHTTIRDSRVGDNCHIDRSVIISSEVGDNCHIGPFAYLRPGTVLEEGVKIGDFVEIKATRVGKGSKILHLSYIGDAQVGREVNIGAGTITCNFDGQSKWPTIIEDGAFIGSNTNLVAPVRVGAGAMVGAGSTITEDVPPDALAIARARQVNLEGRAKEKREKWARERKKEK